MAAAVAAGRRLLLLRPVRHQRFGGEDQAGFLGLVEEVGASRTVLVGIDVGKVEALGLIADARGELLAEPIVFTLDEPGVSALEPTTSLSPGIRIGAGWLTSTQHGRTTTWHNGATGGFRSWMGLDRDAGVGVIVLSARNRFLDPAGFALLRERTTT